MSESDSDSEYWEDDIDDGYLNPVKAMNDLNFDQINYWIAKGKVINKFIQKNYLSNPKTVLKRATKQGDIKIMKLLLESGHNVDFLADEWGGEPCLFITTLFEGHIKAAKLLLKYGANPNFQQKYEGLPGITPIVFTSNIKIMKLLLRAGANLFLKISDKSNILDFANQNNLLNAPFFNNWVLRKRLLPNIVWCLRKIKINKWILKNILNKIFRLHFN